MLGEHTMTINFSYRAIPNLTLMAAFFKNGRRDIHVLISQFLIHVDVVSKHTWQISLDWLFSVNKISVCLSYIFWAKDYKKKQWWIRKFNIWPSWQSFFSKMAARIYVFHFRDQGLHKMQLKYANLIFLSQWWSFFKMAARIYIS